MTGLVSVLEAGRGAGPRQEKGPLSVQSSCLLCHYVTHLHYNTSIRSPRHSHDLSVMSIKGFQVANVDDMRHLLISWQGLVSPQLHSTT